MRLLEEEGVQAGKARMRGDRPAPAGTGAQHRGGDDDGQATQELLHNHDGYEYMYFHRCAWQVSSACQPHAPSHPVSSSPLTSQSKQQGPGVYTRMSGPTLDRDTTMLLRGSPPHAGSISEGGFRASRKYEGRFRPKTRVEIVSSKHAFIRGGYRGFRDGFHR